MLPTSKEVHEATPLSNVTTKCWKGYKKYKGHISKKGEFTFTDICKGKSCCEWLGCKDYPGEGGNWGQCLVSITPSTTTLPTTGNKEWGGADEGRGEWVERIRAGIHHIINLELSIRVNISVSKSLV